MPRSAATRHRASFDREGRALAGGGARGAAVPWQAVVISGTGPAGASYDMNAAFMSLELHDGGIHVVWPGAGGADVTGVVSARAGRPVAGAGRIKINPSYVALGYDTRNRSQGDDGPR